MTKTVKINNKVYTVTRKGHVVYTKALPVFVIAALLSRGLIVVIK